MLADTHCHLDFNSFDADRQQVIQRAREIGVERIVNPGIDLASSQAAVMLAQSEPGVYAAVGVHPNEALSWKEHTLRELHGLASHSEVVAIGEIGLDYYRDKAPREVQRQVLQEQLEFAATLGLPVIIHNREASEDLLIILTAWHDSLLAKGSSLAARPGVLHSFSEAGELAWRAIERNFFIGFTGPVTFRNSPVVQRLATELPLEHIVVETDAPFLAPHPHRGKRNEPAFVRLVVEKIADLKEMTVDSIASITTANAQRLFNW